MSIAVLITTHNASRYISEALDSISRQQRKPDEVFVIDDESTDDTNDIVAEWASRQTFEVQMLANEFSHKDFPCPGPAGSRNTGLSRTEADFIAVLDHDDLMLPEHLQLTEQALLRHPEMELCFGDATEFVDASPGREERSLFAGKPIENVKFTETRDGLRILAEPMLESLSGGSYVPTAANLWRRQTGTGIGGFDRRAGGADDMLFFSKVSRKGSVGYYPFPIARKRVHSDNMSHERHALQHGLDLYNVLEILLTERELLNLTAREEATLHRQMAEARRGVLYHASRKGLSTYLEIGKMLGEAGPWELRDSLRALAWTLRSYVSEEYRRPVPVRSVSEPC